MRFSTWKINKNYLFKLQLHSEYRSTYRWHEYTGGSRPEVIRKPPIANQFGKYIYAINYILYLYF